MKNNLETFVKENREAFDTLEPSTDLWNTIDSKFQNSASISSKISWLKTFVFGASVVTGIIIVSFKSTGSNKKNSIEKISPELKSPSISKNEIKSEVQHQNENINTEKKVSSDGMSEINHVSALTFKPEFEHNNLQTILSEKYPLVHFPFETKKSNMLTSGKSQICFCSCGDQIGTSILNDTVFNGITEIEICSNYANIAITGNEEDKTFLDFQYIQKEEKKKKEKIEQNKISYEIVNSKLTISISSGKKKFSRIGNTCISQIQLNLRVPISTLVSVKNSNGDVAVKNISNTTSKIDNSNGDVNIADLNSDLKVNLRMGDLEIINSKGKLKADTGLGDMNISDFTGDVTTNSTSGDTKISTIKGNLNIESSLGQQECRNISGNILSESTSGDIKFYDCVGNIEIESSLGDQEYQNITGNIKSHSTSGDLKIKNTYGNIDFASSLGDINLEKHKGNMIISTTSGNIAGKNIELIDNTSITSNLGDVHLSLINKMDDLSFDLKTNLGNIKIKKDGQEIAESKKLVVNKGKIMVKGFTSSGDIVFN